MRLAHAGSAKEDWVHSIVRKKPRDLSSLAVSRPPPSPRPGVRGPASTPRRAFKPAAFLLGPPFIRVVVLAAMAVGAVIYALIRQATHPRLPILVPRTAPSTAPASRSRRPGEDEPGERANGEIPAPELLRGNDDGG